MYNSVIYNIKGYSIPIPKKYKDEYFFQKELNLKFQGHRTELEIAKILYTNPLPNCGEIITNTR